MLTGSELEVIKSDFGFLAIAITQALPFDRCNRHQRLSLLKVERNLSTFGATTKAQ